MKPEPLFRVLPDFFFDDGVAMLGKPDHVILEVPGLLERDLLGYFENDFFWFVMNETGTMGISRLRCSWDTEGMAHTFLEKKSTNTLTNI